MTGIPFSYSLRNLWTRRLTTVLTVSGMALVVFVFTTILMLAEGLERTLVETGSYDNAVIIRKGSGSEVQSWIDRAQAGSSKRTSSLRPGPTENISSPGNSCPHRTSQEGYQQVSNVTIRGS